MPTTTEPLTGAAAEIVDRARVLGEDWRTPRAPRDNDVRLTIPPRSKSQTWQVGDIYLDGSIRWVIRVIDGEHVELASSNSVNADIWWTTTLTNLRSKP